MRAVGFAASIRTSSTRRKANPWASENRSLSLSEKRGRNERGGRLCLSGARRTYNKLKSHHPRDLAAITQPLSLGVGERSAQVSGHFSLSRRLRRLRENNVGDDRNNDGESARAMTMVRD